MAAGDTVPAHPADVSMYWSIFFLDLGVVVPTAIATGIGLLAGAAWARRAVFGVVGWFALVPPSVAAMAIVKLLRNDPNATVGDTAVLAAVTLMFWLVAVRLYRPLFRRSGLGPAPRRALAAAGAR
jgi:ABC-type Na+ efflux pump permease subunit